jgi:hypothetical protein
MGAKGMLGVGVAALVSRMRSHFIVADHIEAKGADEERNGADPSHRKSVERKVLREEFIVFAAVASAYLLAWAASRVFQQ